MTVGESLKDFLIARIAQCCDLDEQDIDPDQVLAELGLSSRDAVAVIGEVQDLLGRPLSPVVVWQYPTINQMVVGLTAEQAPASQDVAPSGAANSIAVVGLGCRLPGGVSGPVEYWRLLRDGRDAVGEVPSGRWEAFGLGGLGASTTRWGGFLDDLAGFDAKFFGVSPCEADLMDPQQRLLLEVAWEALEHAGIAPRSLAGSRTGVFVGVTSSEYTYLTTADVERIEGWTATGAAPSVVANRVSYLLDLRGPSMVVDTACSSSLVAIHLAVRSLRDGESDLAVAGGVNLLLSPLITRSFDEAGGTSPDGRCKAFSAAANGMVRGEGCGVVVLKRLADAERDGDRVLAVVEGTAVNSDGRSNGLVAPNPRAQRQVLQAACADAGMLPTAIGYVEAHGTGTPLGDPIEAQAIADAFCGGREEPLLLGSVKTNIGHLEAAAGVAGLIKAVLAVQEGYLPASLHFAEPSPHVDFDDLRLRVVAEGVPWPAGERVAGVSSFGFGGTNAHVVLRQAGQSETRSAEARVGRYLLADLTAQRLRDHAGVLVDWVRSSPAALADVAHTLARRGRRGPAGAAVVARDRAELVAGLTALHEDRPYPAVVTGSSSGSRARPVWVFSGYQREWGELRELAEAEPVFAAAVGELDAIFTVEAGFSLRGAVFGGVPPRGPAQMMPAVFGVQVALARVLDAHGVRPAAVIGHSMGEVAAAVVAGALSVQNGAKVISVRSRLLAGGLAGHGAMAVLGLSGEELPDGFPGVAVAVYSSPEQCVVSGDRNQVRALAELVESRGLFARLLDVEGAGHSSLVEPLLPELTSTLAHLPAGIARMPFYSTAVDGVPTFDATYWAANLRSPVRFSQAVAAAARDGHRAFVEIAPHPLLQLPITETLAHQGIDQALVTATVRRGEDPLIAFHAQLAALHLRGQPAALPAGRIVDVPSAPWRHTRHWVDARPARRGAPGTFFERRWRPSPLPPTVQAAGTWLALGADDELVEALRAAGDRVDTVEVAGRAYTDVLMLTGPGARQPDPAAAQHLVLLSCDALRNAVRLGTRLWLVTRGGRPDVACLRGVARVLAFEHPEVRATLISIDSDTDPAVLRTELTADTAHDEISWFDGARHTAELAPVAPEPGANREAVRRGGGYLVTGGYGGLGLVVAGWLAEKGARRVVLNGRSGPTPDAEKIVTELAERGCEVVVVTGDLAEPGVARRLVDAAGADGVALRGVVHAAGVLNDRMAVEVRPRDLATVWAAKAHGAWQLHCATADADLDWWVGFSSAAALLGAPGQLAYASANAWLDALVCWRHAQGLPATTINWGTWSDSGDATDGNRIEVLRPLSPADGIAALESVLASRRVATGVFDVRADAVVEAFPSVRTMPYFARFEWPQREDRGPLVKPTRVQLAEQVRLRVSAILGTGLDHTGLDRTVPLRDVGLDSLVATRIKNTLQHDFGVAIPPAMLLRGGTLADLEALLAAELGIHHTPEVTPQPVRPGDATARLAVLACERALGRGRVEMRDTIFADGDGPAAVQRLLAELAPHVDIPIDIAELRRCPTPEALVELIKNHRTKTGLVRPLGTGGTRPPLFLAHPAGEDSSVYLQLAELLGDDQPSYGLDRIADVLDLRSRAARCVESLTSTFDGRYRLGGWSYGGVLAYETARQLAEYGADVEVVALIDAGLPLPLDVPEREAVARRLVRFASYLTEMFGRPIDLDRAELSTMDDQAQFDLTMSRIAAAGLGIEITSAIKQHQVDSFEDTRALERYQPQPYHGRVMLYRASEPTPWRVPDPRFNRSDETLGWEQWCTDLTVVHVPGHHLNLLDPPNVHALAERLQSLLAEGST